MGSQRNYDTVAFDVRDQTSMLFFAKTSDNGDIDDIGEVGVVRVQSLRVSLLSTEDEVKASGSVDSYK